MHRSFLFSTAALAGILALGCADQQSPTGPAELPTPSIRAEHQIVLNAIYLGGDPSNPLVVGAGFEAGITPQDVCDGNGGLPQGVGKRVLTPPGGLHEHTFGRDVLLDVFAFGGGSGDPCAFAEAPLVGSGTGKFTFNVEISGPGAVVIHATVRGIVDLVSGGQARVFGTARVTILPDGTLLFAEERVRLTPR
jgi:hypothetical protein